MKFLSVVFLLMASLLISTNVFSAVDESNAIKINYAITPVTTSAYTQVSASSPISVNRLLLCDFTGHAYYFASGPAGNEKTMFVFGVDHLVSGCMIVQYYIPAGARISIKSADTNVSSGLSFISFLQ